MLKIQILKAMLCALTFALSACQTKSASRAPNSTQFEFDSSKVELLTWAAKNRILFQVSDSSLSDVALVQAEEKCKTVKEPAWTQTAFAALETLKSTAALQNKIHVIEIKKDVSPNVELTKDLDGLTYLILSYSASEKKTLIADLSEIPCDNKTPFSIGEELTHMSFELPTKLMMTKAVKDLPARVTPDRWKFKNEFLLYLAGKMTILRFSAALGFERSATGDFFLSQFLSEQSEAIKKNQLATFDYWLAEISQRSHAGSYLKMLALVQDKQLGYGMKTTLNSQGLAYPFLSYKSEDGKYTYTTLSQLDKCLEDLSNRYKRGLASIRADFSTQPDSFLSPGHVCYVANP